MNNDNDFSRMMSQQGVRPLHNPRQTPRTPPREQQGLSSVDAGQHPSSEWATGRKAFDIIEHSMRRYNREGGQLIFMVRSTDPRNAGLLQDIGSRIISRSASDLIEKADRFDAELIVICGRGWKTMLHPSAGAVFFSRNPPELKGE